MYFQNYDYFARSAIPYIARPVNVRRQGENLWSAL